MRAAAWRRATASELQRLATAHHPRGKQRRDWKRKAKDLLDCGRFVGAHACDGCGHVLGKSGTLIASCGLRVCPVCARRRANLLRVRLGRLLTDATGDRREGLYLLTFTLKYDPASEADLSIEGLRRRKALVIEGFRYVWRRYLKGRTRGAVRAVEVSPRGAVHVHVLCHGRRPDIRIVRAAWMLKVGDSPIVNVKRVRRPKKAIAELAKYVTKGASPARASVLGGGLGRFTNPVLAARIEVAFSGDRLSESYGAWRGTDDEADEPQECPTEACPHCGLLGEWHQVVMSLDRWLQVAGRAPPRIAGSVRPVPKPVPRDHN